MISNYADIFISHIIVYNVNKQIGDIMKTAVLYYSLEGHTQKAAKIIAKAAEADLIRIEPEKDIPSKGFLRILKGGFLSVTKKCPKLKPVSQDLSQYDQLFIGTPVWAGSISAAIRSLLNQNSFAGKKVALFNTFANSSGDSVTVMKDLLPNAEIIGVNEEIGPLTKSKYIDRDKLSQWAKKICGK